MDAHVNTAVLQSEGEVGDVALEAVPNLDSTDTLTTMSRDDWTQLSNLSDTFASSPPLGLGIGVASSPCPGKGTRREPIAICGIALRLPGGIRNTETFWSVLHDGRDMRSEIPVSRFNAAGFDRSMGPTGFDIRHGYFLDGDLGHLDTSFFSCRKAELEKMDPQIRQLLEVTGECLESAGETQYRGKRIGCYVGTFGDDWLLIQSKETLQSGEGHGLNMDLLLANRVSYEYDFVGPSMVIKTGCSASMVAVHEACRALQAGDIDGAVVGGTSLILTPHMYAMMASDGILSPEGSCKTFDASADGFARAEAINAIYLRRLDDAVRNGYPIRAVIRGTGVNTNGFNTDGLISPDTASQAALIRDVYESAALDPSETPYIECHGTGTLQGDRKEVLAIANVFGDKGAYLGSVKANVGHSEGASGITSLIKSVLVLEKRMIPPQIKFNQPNPDIPFDRHKLVVPVEVTSWPTNRAERISVNSFGIGGSNAHVIIESFTHYRPQHIAAAPSHPDGQQAKAAILVLSANSLKSLQQLADDVTEYYKRHPGCLQDLCYTLALRREIRTYRSFVLLEDGVVVRSTSGIKPPASPPKLVMIFSGQGAQWPQMGLEHMASDSEFQRDMEAMDAMLQQLQHPPSWSLVEELGKDVESSRVYEAEIAQPLCTALQIGLVRSLARRGIHPDTVIGHSSGEIAAAYTAGALSLAEAVTISYYRGFVMREFSQAGAMAAINLRASDIQPLLAEGVVIAAENSPRSTTISGDTAAIERTISLIRDQHPDIFCRKLVVDTAYHSHHMVSPAARYRQHLVDELGNVASRAPTIAMYSTVYGDAHDAPVPPTYWSKNLTSRVRFLSAVTSAITDLPGCILLEVGPHSQLKGPVREVVSNQTCAGSYHYVSTMVRSENQVATLLRAVGELWQRGLAVDLSSLARSGRALGDLPAYSWDHSGGHFWHESRVAKGWRHREFPQHSLLGQRIPESSSIEPSWRAMIDLGLESWLADHRVKGDVVFPFAGYISMAGEAIRQLARVDSGYSIRDIVAHRAMLLYQHRPVEVITSLRPQRLTDSADSDWHHFSITSDAGHGWVKHCEGLVRPINGHMDTGNISGSCLRLPRKVSPSGLYASLERAGIQLGPNFQRLSAIESSPIHSQARCVIGAPAAGRGVNETPYHMHPTAIDACLQSGLVAMVRGSSRAISQLAVPSRIEEVNILSSPGRPHGSLSVVASADPNNQERTTITAGDVKGTIVFQLRGFTLSSLDDETDRDDDRHAACRLAWHPHVDFIDAATLLKPPAVDVDARKILEELTLLLILDSEEISRAVEVEREHLVRLKQWLRRSKEEAIAGQYPMLEPSVTASLLSIGREQRAAEVERRFSLLIGTPCHSIAKVVRRTHDNLASLLAGDVEAIALLMEGNLLAEMYSAITFNMAPFVHQLCISKPGLRILEVGAGTGGTTATILEGVPLGLRSQPGYAQYTFTDVSAAFFTAAQERFHSAANVEYHTLDAAADVLAQGFEAASYDLVIAANVIHALPSIREALANLRVLLRPGGQLLLLELCCEMKSPGYVFGHFSGWWLGREENRKWTPYIPIEQWDIELKAAGFSGVDTAVPDAAPPFQLCATILSHSLPQVHSRPAPPLPIAMLHREPDSPITARLAVHFASLGHPVTTVKLGSSLPASDAVVVATLDHESSAFFDNISAEELAAFQQLCRHYQSRELLWLMPRVGVRCTDPRAAQTTGALGVFRNEGSLPFFTLQMAADEPNFAHLVVQVLHRIWARDTARRVTIDNDFVVDAGVVRVSRLEPISLWDGLARPRRDEGMVKRLEVNQVGSLSSLHWVCRAAVEPADDEVVIEARAVGLNFKDLFAVLGTHGFLFDKATLGVEVSGIVTRTGSSIRHLQVGDRVAGFCATGCFSTHPVLKGLACVKIHHEISFEDAASLTVAYFTACYSLINIAQLRPGQTVLIHSGCGGLGLAALQVCKMVGAEAYITVGAHAKVEYATDVLGLPRDRIFFSRNDSFVRGIMEATNGRGVDIVLNSLSGPLLHASWRCVAEFGTMVELGKADIVGHASLDMAPFLQNRSFRCVDMASLSVRRIDIAHQVLVQAFDYIAQGKLGLLEKVTVFEAAQAQSAFRWLQDGDHIGKAVVRIPESSAITADPLGYESISFSSNASYLLTGGLGGLGKSVARWMTERGARNLIFLSRSAGTTSADVDFLMELEAMGCRGIPVVGRVDTIADVRRAIAQAPGPIKGVIHLAMVQQEGVGVELSHDDWRAAVTPKVDGAWNLHNCLAESQAPLDFFVMTSSVLTISHLPGESNYGAGSTFLEAFSQYRRGLGLPASTLVVCPISEAGFIEENPVVMRRVRSGGYYFLSEKEFIDFIEYSIQHQLPADDGDMGSPGGPTDPWSDGGYVAMGIHSQTPLSDPQCRLGWRQDPRLGTHHNLRSDTRAGLEAGIAADRVTELLARARADPLALQDPGVVGIVATEIARRVRTIMMQDWQEEDVGLTLRQMGADSLMGVELRRWWRLTFGIEMATLELMAGGTLHDLAVKTVEKVKLLLCSH